MNSNKLKLICEACSSDMSSGLSNWHFLCRNCGLERSTLEPQINQLKSINEIERENALRPIREHNFKLLVQRLKELSLSVTDKKHKLLDVGSAHGWFLEAAQNEFDVLGIEPDEIVANSALKKDLNVRKGFFPEVLGVQERFDIIIFNDVLEHIPTVKNILSQTAQHLSENGLLVINAPDSRGFFYRFSKLLHHFGKVGSFDRMWQVGMPSPHLYYFDRNSIDKIARQAGFKMIEEHSLSSIVVKGLFDRINYAGGNKLINMLIGCAVLCSIPILKLTKSDISVWFFKK